jgi:Uma2 family endonuclease
MKLDTRSTPLTEAEYLAIERAAPSKSEFHGGEMFAMAGGSPMHSLIAANLIALLHRALSGSGCLTFTSDLRVKVDMTGLYTYPDVSVACGELCFAEVFANVAFPQTGAPHGTAAGMDLPPPRS